MEDSFDQDGAEVGRNPDRDRIQMERTRARLIEAGQEAILETGLDPMDR